MGLMLGENAPDFIAETTLGTIRFHEWLGNNWCMLFSHPGDYTPVCTTEISACARMEAEFKLRGVKLMGLSVDSLDSHHEWVKQINTTFRVTVDFPIIADPDRRIADMYGMLYAVEMRPTYRNETVRSVFIIDPHKRIRLVVSYPEATGRDFREILRVIDSLQRTDKHQVNTPANWKPGDDCLLPQDLSPEQLHAKCPAGWMQLLPYLRFTPDPGRKHERAALGAHGP